MNDTLQMFHTSISKTLTMLMSDIDNCPMELWEKKVGGDFYWQQIYHAFASLHLFLKDDSSQELPLSENAADLKGNFTGGTPTKQLVKQVGQMVMRHTERYFESIHPDMLATKLNFFDNVVPLSDILMMCCTHLSYHLGLCDGALRDAGAKAAM